MCTAVRFFEDLGFTRDVMVSGWQVRRFPHLREKKKGSLPYQY